MTTKRKPYKTYTREFKLEAIRMLESSDRPASEVAMELGIRRNQLYKWKEQLASKGEVSTLLGFHTGVRVFQWHSESAEFRLRIRGCR